MKYVILLSILISTNVFAGTLNLKSGVYATSSRYCGIRAVQSEDKTMLVVEFIGNPRIPKAKCLNYGEIEIHLLLADNLYRYKNDEKMLSYFLLTETAFRIGDSLYTKWKPRH